MTSPPPAPNRPSQLLDRLEDDLRGLSAGWLSRTGGLCDFLERWEHGWNSHDLTVLEPMVTRDVTWEDPAMHGDIVHGRTEFSAFTRLFFDAFPDVHIEGVGAPYLAAPYLALEGTGFGVRWRMTGTFTGDLTIWGSSMGSEPPVLAPTGRTFEIEGVDLYALRDGLVSDYFIAYDLMGFSRQIGLLG